MSTSTAPNLANAPDLNKEFPRSPAALIGDYVLLARAVDKCRAMLAGTVGEYKYACPLDQRFFQFTGINPDDLKNFIATGASDEEIGKWVRERDPHTDDEVLIWGYEQRTRQPEGDSRAYFESYRREYAADKPYISTWFELLDAEEGRYK